MKIFHGSQNIIKVPQYGLGKVGNDFGLGFYCTENEDMSKEWSVQPNREYMNTILAERIGNDDERIPRNAAP